MAYNAADETQVEERTRKDKRGRELELDDMAALLATKGGRRIIWRYLDKCGVFRTSMTGNSQTFFNEGMRNIGLMLLTDINEADPMAYVTMMQEHSEALA